MVRGLVILAALTVCGPVQPGTAGEKTFGEDVAYLRRHVEVIVLEDGASRVAVVPEYQGRVMTSTVGGDDGPSYGFLKYDVIEAGVLPPPQRAGRLQDHIHVFGGEERFWLGPEGGQFSIFFPPGAEFEFENWKTPAAIDTAAYSVVKHGPREAVLRHACTLQNWSGVTLEIGIERAVRLLDRAAVEMLTGALPTEVTCVAYETDNRIQNRGGSAWTRETGMPSIWILGMFKPGPATTVVIPFNPGPEESLGPKVNDAYFGAVPKDHLRVEDDVLFFKGDGLRRGKIGISPERSRGIAGSYDPGAGMLTLVTYTRPESHPGYVNSMWELQEDPFRGDAINAYNDGSPAPGTPPLGPFYELETSSPAADLEPGESLRHVQRTIHLEGPEALLDPVIQRTLGVSLADIRGAW